MKKRTKYLITVVSVMLLPLGWLLAETVNDKAVLYTVIEIIKKVYVKETTDKQLVESAISGMLSELDPHSSFMDEKEFDEMKTVTKGEFGGIGVEIMVESPGLRVISPIDDTPAFKAGVKPGDMIFAIDDQIISNMTPTEAINKMRGPKDTKVKISILRSGVADPIDISLSRDIIKANPVKQHLYGDYGYIRIATFSFQTTEAVIKAIEELKKEAGKKEIKGYILDLRNNPGGVLEQSVSVANLFLNNGLIVSTKGRDNKVQMSFSADPSKTLVKDKPIVVLINNGSASASEIVAGALQDHKKALILGTKSFGKGSVQTVMSIPGYGAMRITTALYYTPADRSIQAEGIVPDIAVEQAKVELLTNKDKKLDFSEASLRNHLTNKTSAILEEKDLDKKKAEFWNKLYEQDYQLARALDVLKSMVLIKKW